MKIRFYSDRVRTSIQIKRARVERGTGFRLTSYICVGLGLFVLGQRIDIVIIELAEG